MSKYIILLLLTISTINASKILSYNVYDRTDRADVMITFDTPYDGVIKQSIGKSRIIIKLTDASIESSKRKKISSNFLHSITIIPLSGQTKIIASVPSSVKLLASKTSDSYGLRLRFVNKNSSSSSKKKETEVVNNLSSLPTKANVDMSQSYYIVIFILIIGIIILFIIKKKITLKSQNNKQNKNNWLFKENNQKNIKDVPQQNINLNQENIKIRFQKSIDNQNSVVMLDFGEYSYLILMGNGNILLDKFTDNKPTTQEDFESILQNRHQELEKFLNVEPDTNRSEFFSTNSNNSNEALKSYNERAGLMAYES